MKTIHRLRVFAGPNGSGKSTLFSKISARIDCGIMVNADEIKQKLDMFYQLDIQKEYGISILQEQLDSAISSSPLLIEKAHKVGENIRLKMQNGILHSQSDNRLGYEAALVAQIIRSELTKQHRSFSFESVFSDKVKISELENAKENGYRIYLYFVNLKSPELNTLRVEDRVQKDGHFVPIQKIEKRYYGSLQNLTAMSSFCNRCYFFDNSGSEMALLAELDEGDFKSHCSDAPFWFMEYFLKPMRLV